MRERHIKYVDEMNALSDKASKEVASKNINQMKKIASMTKSPVAFLQILKRTRSARKAEYLKTTKSMQAEAVKLGSQFAMGK